jgi:hypothetical protein
MSKYFRPWNIDQTLLLPPNVQDFVPKGHVSRFIVELVRESLDLKEITGSYVSGLGQPPFDPRMMVALLLHGYASGCARLSIKTSIQCHDRFGSWLLSLRSGLNSRTTWRLSAFIMPMRAIMVGPFFSATRIRHSIAACHSPRFCSALGSFMM